MNKKLGSIIIILLIIIFGLVFSIQKNNHETLFNNINLGGIANIGVIYSESEISTIIDTLCEKEFDPLLDFDGNYDNEFDCLASTYRLNDAYSNMNIIKHSENKYEIIRILMIYPENSPVIEYNTIFDDYIGKNIEDLFDYILEDPNIKQYSKLILSDGNIKFKPILGTRSSTTPSDMNSGKYLELKIIGFEISKYFIYN